MQTQTYSLSIAGKTIHAEFTDLTPHTNGSVLMKMGDTTVLITTVMGSEQKDNLDYLPLSVEFEERFYAAGQILGSRFHRREGRPSDEAVLSARIIDRTIRPLFDQRLRREVQVVATVLAMGEDDPDVLAVIGTSLALGVSDIPWQGPVGAVRIARHKTTEEIVINPTYQERADQHLNFEVLVCGKGGLINMIETAADEVSEEDMVDILDAATHLHQQIEQFQLTIIAERGATKQSIVPADVPNELEQYFADTYATRLVETIFSGRTGKSHITSLKEDWTKTVADTYPHYKPIADSYFDTQVNIVLHQGALAHERRADGRGFDEVRPLFAKAGGISAAIHGSGIFYRGETRIFTALTLGGRDAAEHIDTIELPDTTKHFMHHYNFPPFSVGEIGKVGGFNRRMIGHGNLAERALRPVIPNQSDFPYTIRLVSETLSSNGSSSMGSVCASTIALMDGGVPITKPVAGVATGVMLDSERHSILTDIQGPEDEYGDMDLKVAGTRDGITAMQMDVKVTGVSVTILAEALMKAKLARLHIIDTICSVIAEPRAAISPRAPHVATLTIKPEQIGHVIGGGGKTIKHIKDTSGVHDITVEDDGSVFIVGTKIATDRAAAAIKTLTKVFTVGDEVTATITRVASFGAFAALDEHHEGLIHISEIATWRLPSLAGVITPGETVRVRISKIEDGKIGLSIKQVDPDFVVRKGFTPPPTDR